MRTGLVRNHCKHFQNSPIVKQSCHMLALHSTSNNTMHQMVAAEVAVTIVGIIMLRGSSSSSSSHQQQEEEL